MEREEEDRDIHEPLARCALVCINGTVGREGSGAWWLPHGGTLTGKDTVVSNRECRCRCSGWYQLLPVRNRDCIGEDDERWHVIVRTEWELLVLVEIVIMHLLHAIVHPQEVREGHPGIHGTVVEEMADQLRNAQQLAQLGAEDEH